MIWPRTSEEEGKQLEALWRQELAANDILRRYWVSGEQAHVHLDLIRGE